MPHKCQKCQDRGWVFHQDQQGVEWAVTCECQKQRQIERIVDSSGISDAFQRKTLINFEIKDIHPKVFEAFKIARDYVKGFGEIKDTEHNSLLLCGEPGSGKTHLIAAVANQLMSQEIPVLYFMYVEHMDQLKTLAVTNREEMEQKIKEIREVPVLLIDDLYKGRPDLTPIVKEIMFNIINYRYLNCLPMLVSTELTRQEILASDTGIGRRIIERAKGHTVELVDREKPLSLNYWMRGMV